MLQAIVLATSFVKPATKMMERTAVKFACPGDVVDVALERQCAVQFDTERLQCS